MDWESFYQNYRKPDYLKGYDIVNKLGAGVFGEVYKIRKLSIGKFYAIKFLRVEDPSLKSAVVRELESVKLLAQIDHPNLVSIEDQGEVDGIPYIIMSYAGEETLKSVLQKGTLTREKSLDYFRQICAGVQALHDRSIVHFDLKPANIYLKGELARVGDYGLSKLISRTRRSLSFSRGTPYYMAPEMLKRRGDQASDLYSLGVILFECLSGDVPFKGDTEWEILKKHETEAVTFPASIQDPFRSAISRAMAKEPGDRYSSVTDFKQSISPPRLAHLKSPMSQSSEGFVHSRGPKASFPPESQDSPYPGSEELPAGFSISPARFLFTLTMKTVEFTVSMLIGLVKIPLRFVEWSLQIAVFFVLVAIFFVVLHMLFNIPMIFLRFL